MLSKENNLLLCSVGPGTPTGQLFRSMWLPAMLSSQLPDRAGPPVRLKLLGEELVAFRDGEGRVGIVQSQCAHRLAPLFLGRVEQQGIRCPYHGWLYDSTGQCLEIPSEPSGSVCRNMKIKAYQTTEKADIVWVYMGEGAPPALPKFPWIDLPKDQRMASVWLQESNWFQGVEGEVDSSHVSILHKSKSQKEVATMVHQKYTFLDPTPKLFTHDTPAGFLSIARRRADDRFYWRLTQWMLPMFSLIPSAVWPIGGRAWIPIDDENTYTWDFSYSLEQPIPPAFLRTVLDGVLFPPSADYGRIRLNTGSVIETWVPRRRADNDYLIDRRQQAEDCGSQRHLRRQRPGPRGPGRHGSHLGPPAREAGGCRPDRRHGSPQDAGGHQVAGVDRAVPQAHRRRQRVRLQPDRHRSSIPTTCRCSSSRSASNDGVPRRAAVRGCPGHPARRTTAAGRGPLLVLLHGSSPGACSELNWFRNFDALVRGRLRGASPLTSPGFGYSSAPRTMAIEFRYRHAEAVLQALDAGRSVLVGNSLGGLLAVLAAHRPSARGRLRIDGLVLAAQFPHFEIPAQTRARMQQHLARLASVEPTAPSVRA